MGRAAVQTSDTMGISPTGAPVDLTHLARHTLGDQGLEREVLQLFVRQSAIVLNRLDSAESARAVSEQAHTIKGSARGIGAWKVAQAAELVQAEAELGGATSISELRAAVQETIGFIGALLEDQPSQKS